MSPIISTGLAKMYWKWNMPKDNAGSKKLPISTVDLMKRRKRASRSAYQLISSQLNTER